MLAHHIDLLFPNLKYEGQIEWLGHRPALVDYCL